MEWSRETAINLIEIYKQYPCLWNPGDSQYFNKIKKEDAWKEISEQLNIPQDECRKTILSLLACFRKEKKKEKNSTGTGKGM